MKNLFKDLIKGTLKGKSILRILINNRIRENQKLKGRILDLGSGTVRPSYYGFLRMGKDSKIISVDISDERKPDIKADLEKPFPFRDKEFNHVLCFNLLEHIFNYRNVINESFRVLKNNESIIGAVPFLGSVHDDPSDYFRYTQSSLEKIFRKAGFKEIKIESLGYGPFTASCYMIAFLFPKFLRIFLLFPAIVLDKLIVKFNKKHGKEKYVLIYYFECRK